MQEDIHKIDLSHVMVEPIKVDPYYYRQGQRWLKPWLWPYKNKYGMWRKQNYYRAKRAYFHFKIYHARKRLKNRINENT